MPLAAPPHTLEVDPSWGCIPRTKQMSKRDQVQSHRKSIRLFPVQGRIYQKLVTHHDGRVRVPNTRAASLKRSSVCPSKQRVRRVCVTVVLDLGFRGVAFGGCCDVSLLEPSPAKTIVAMPACTDTSTTSKKECQLPHRQKTCVASSSMITLESPELYRLMYQKRSTLRTPAPITTYHVAV